MNNVLQVREHLWNQGILTWKFHKGQELLNNTFNNSVGQVVVFNIARQYGKTFFAVTKAIELAIQKKSRISYATAFETDLLNFVLPVFETILDDCPISLKPQYIGHKRRFIFNNGSEIRLIGLDRKPNGLRGNTSDLCILDEAGFISRLDYLHTSVLVPLTTHRPEAKILLLSTPPETPSHPFWDFVERAKLEGAYQCFTIDQNPLLTPVNIARIEKEMGGRTTTAFRREYLCERIVEESRAIVPEWDNKFVEEPFIDDFFPYYHRYESMDLGVKRDLTVNLFAHYDFKKATLYIWDELAMNGPDMNTNLLANQIKEREKLLWKKDNSEEIHNIFLRISDNNNPLLVNDLIQLHDLPFIATNKESLHEMVNLVKIWVGNGRVKVHPRCKLLIGSLESGIWNEQRTQFDRSKVYGHYDALAALVYLIRNIDDSYNPIPEHFGKNKFDYFIDNNKPHISQAGKALQKAFLK